MNRCRRPLRPLSALVAGGLVAAVLTSCSAGGEDVAPTATPAPSGTDAALAPSPSPSGGEAAVDLPLPSNVTLTEPGSDLGLGDSATVTWRPRQDEVGVIRVQVNHVRRTTFARSFTGWRLDAATRATTPFFVEATVTNLGRSDLAKQSVPLYAVDSAGTLVEATRFAKPFSPCPKGRFPASFAPGEQAKVCLVYLSPAKGDLRAVSFQPTQDYDAITWTGPVRLVGKDSRSGKGGGPRKAGKAGKAGKARKGS